MDPTRARRDRHNSLERRCGSNPNPTLGKRKGYASGTSEEELNKIQETLSAKFSTVESITPQWDSIKQVLSQKENIPLEQETLVASILSVAQSRFGFNISENKNFLSKRSQKYSDILNKYDTKEKNVKELINEINNLFKDDSESSKNQAIAQLVNSKKIPLDLLEFDEEKIKSLIPYLKVLDFQECEDSFACNILAYLEDHSEYSSNIRELHLKNCSFQEWPELPNCLYLSFPKCPDITYLPSLPLCVEIDCSDCQSLDEIGKLEQDFPNCRVLNCSNCPSLSELIGFENCRDLNCSDCPNLLELIGFEKCIRINCRNCYSFSTELIFPKCQYFDCRGCYDFDELDVSEQLPAVTLRGLELGVEQKLVMEIDLGRDQINNYPKDMIAFLYNLIRQEKSFPYIKYKTGKNYENDNGLDEGGVTRDFITRLLASLFSTKEGQRLRLDVERRPIIRGKNISDKSPYWALGAVLIMAYYGKSDLKLGAFFSPEVYRLLLKDLTEHENLIKAFLESQKAPKGTEACFIEQESPDLVKLFQEEALSEGCIEREILEFIWFLEEFTAPSKEDLKQIQEKLKDVERRKELRGEAFENPTFQAVVAMASGIKDLIGKKEWKKICGEGAEQFQKSVEGSVKAEDFKENLSFQSVEGVSQKQLDDVCSWMKKWIDNAREEELKDLLFAMTGNVALVPGKKLEIQVVNKPANSFPIAATCFFKLELSANIQDENAFNEHMQALIASAKSDEQAGGPFQLE